VQPSMPMNIVLFMCVSCRSNQVKKVKEWPREILDNTPGLDKHVSSVAAVLTTDCPRGSCNADFARESVPIGFFGWFFGVVVKAVAESFDMPAFVSLYKNEGDDVGEFEDVNEVCYKCFVPIFSKEEIESMFQVERFLCSFYGQGGKFVPCICIEGGRVLV
jgi:hypothetical protein